VTDSDTTLLRRYARDGSQDAFAEFVRLHVDLVYGAALRRLGGSVHRAQDVTQEVFCDVAKKAEKLSRHPSLSGWLYVSAYHAAAALMRSEHRREVHEQQAMLMNQLNAPIEDENWERLRPIVEQATLKLSAGDREVVLLRFMEKQRYSQIAATLQLTEDAARRRVDRALEKLRGALARHGITSTSAALAAALAAEPVVAAPAGLAATVAEGAYAAAASGAGMSSFAAFVGTISAGKIAASFAIALLVVTMGATLKSYLDYRASERQIVAAEAAHAEKVRDYQKVQVSRVAAARALPSSTGQEKASISPFPGAENGQKLFAQHPDLLTGFQRYVRARPGEIYSRLIPSLGLSADRLKRFLQLNEDRMVMAEQFQQKSYQLFTELAQPAPSPEHPDAMTFMSPPEADEQLRNLLGADGYQELLAFDAAQPARDLVTNFAGNAALAGAPLSTDQYRQAMELAAAGNLSGSQASPGVFSPAQLGQLSAAEARAAFNFEAAHAFEQASQAR